MTDRLPIDEALPALLAALDARPNAVLQAPPGAGKTTRVPLALLDRPWAKGKIIMLEPRRLAARAAARRMAQTLGEAVGETVGYRVRMDTKVGPRTRIEVVTEGILTRMLQSDPELSGVSAVLFDEFHERSLQADLGLALCLECQQGLREDLRLLVMSATLEGGPVAALLADAPVISSEGRSFPVQTIHLEDRDPRTRLEDAAAAAIRRALAEQEGDLLVFLPGAGEIRRTAERLAGINAEVTPLYGDLPAAAQDRAIQPIPGTRKVVLATSIAETSLTIEGIRVVVDCGLSRVPRFEPASGMTRLETVPVSRASAEQRRGRAGRLGPGVCYRLWSEAAHRALPLFSRPEILEADLAPLALDLAQWGVADPAAMAWLDAPPAGAYGAARQLLTELQALDQAGRITAHGRAMAELAMHPRLAHMVLTAKERGLGRLACEIAAILSERDLLASREADLRPRIEGLRAGGSRVDRAARQRAQESVRQWLRQLGIREEADASPEHAGGLVALAYPDRIAQRRGAERSYRLSGGRGAVLPEAEPMAASDWLAVAHLDGDRQQARIWLAAPLTLAEIEDEFEDQITTGPVVRWDGREQAVLARKQRRLFALVLKDEPLARLDPALAVAAMAEGIRQMGLDCLPWTDEARRFQARVEFLRRLQPEDWPDLSDAALLAGIEDWLGPFLEGVTRKAHLAKLPLTQALKAMLPWEQQRRLDELAPSHVAVPSGVSLPIDYAGDEPVLAVRLQQMFGCADTPRVAGGRVPVLLHLLSPAHRPLQVTKDLAGFWAGSYKAVKADMKGQYPKHYWPDDPLQAEPTNRAKPRR